ncbi:MAG TPA: hypothetical protein VN920_14200 [Pyrinomonadaceae bacterium]|nr:hypothetical protein [Pyrinomonadaceae bacterium]
MPRRTPYIDVNENPLELARDSLQVYDAVDLLAAIAALQLMPENSGRIVRLEAAAHVAASLAAGDKQNRISPKKLGFILNSGPLGDARITRNEDPHEFGFTDSIAFIDGPFTVFPGIEDDSVFIVQNLLNAIFRHRRQIQNQDYLNAAFQLVFAVLLLSNEIAGRAGLSRSLNPVYAPEHSVVIPSNKRFAELKTAVIFEQPEIDRLLWSHGIDPSSLEILIKRLGDIDLSSHRLHHGELFRHPIVRVADRYIISLPSRLLSALRHALLVQAVEAGLQSDVVARYTGAVWETVVESLYYLEIHPATLQNDDLPRVPNIAEGMFHLDNDKALYVILATDPLVDYDTNETFGRWTTGDLQERIEGAVDAAVSHLLQLPQPPNDILVLELTQGIGRSYQLAIRNLKWLPFLYLGAADLSTIAQLEGGNKLLLWKYARASARIRQRLEINSASLLDEFFLYRKHGHSYYIADTETYNFISVLPGYAGELREELRRERDWHWVRSYRLGQTIDLLNVTLLHSDSQIPIYISKACVFEAAVELLVEGFAPPVWITNVPFESEEEARARGIYAQLAEAIAYWLWQFTPSLKHWISSLRRKYLRILVEVRLEQPASWETRATRPGEEPAITSETNNAEGTIRMTFKAGMNFLLQGPDNRGEREMMRVLLKELANLVDDDDKNLMSDNAIERMLDRDAPLGVKKKILLFDANSVPEIVREGLPPYRALQRADENELLDELGAYLTVDKGMQIGRVADDQRTSVLQTAVGFFYTELQKLVATLSPDRLLEWLVSYQEAAIRDQVFHQLTIPTRLACFSSEEEMIKRLDKETPRHNLTVVASRFIIEYVTAVPPNGLRPISMSVYDRMQSLASQIIEWGSESDLIHYELVDYPLEILPSGRLGADRTQYQRAHAQYMPSVMSGDISRSTRAFKELWNHEAARTDESANRRLAALNTAAIAEFGFSMSEQLDFVVAAINLGREINPGAAKLSRSDFLVRISATMNQAPERVSSILDMLLLTPRSSFLKPSEPYRTEDVYPWRFNRQLSYLRRPFLLRHRHENNPPSEEILWGIRHLEGCWKNILGLCTQGRLKANSSQMIQLMGAFNRERGKRFNNQVAEVFKTNPNLIVRTGVRKIGSLKLLDQEGDLGDIDVLVLDRKKKRLFLVECKDLAQARTPHEMSSELTNLFRGTDQKKPIVALHQRRTDWARQHVSELLEWLDIKVTKGWKVFPLIVVDRELFTPYLVNSPIPITAVEGLRDFMSKHLTLNN